MQNAIHGWLNSVTLCILVSTRRQLYISRLARAQIHTAFHVSQTPFSKRVAQYWISFLISHIGNDARNMSV